MKVRAITVTVTETDGEIVTGDTEMTTLPAIRPNFVFDGKTYTVTI